jgi:hypothetical protein
VRRIGYSLRGTHLASAARFYRHLLARVELSDQARMWLYMSVPTELCHGIGRASERVADAKELERFLASRRQMESDPKLRDWIERRAKRLRQHIERVEKRP